jgi:5-(carboxyamino)imidazole ribonucleotide synthase
MSNKITLGIIGGGQLGSMLCQAAKKLDIKTIILCDDKEAPASNFSDDFIYSKYDDETNLIDFANRSDFITFEFENIPVNTLKKIQKIKPVYPDPEINSIVQNRFKEKNFINQHKAKTTNFKLIKSKDDLNEINQLIPGILKTTTLGYDGKGQFVINSLNDLKNLRIDCEYILEKKINLKKEISNILTRYQDGKIAIYEPIENIHKDQILDQSKIPADTTDLIIDEAKKTSIVLAEKLNFIGTMCVEYFIDEQDNLLVNEIAPRVHNSGHLTINAYDVSQFEGHIRAVCNLEYKNPKKTFDATMKNIIGAEIDNYRSMNFTDKQFFFDYLKKETKPKRKMGHLTTIN